MPRLFDISTWTEQPWWNTGGTRNKKVYLNPEDNLQYYFKQSLKKENKDYKYEFWSEIIASEIGQLCGFDILPYDIATRGNEAGCLSKTMINPDKEELVEGGKYLQAFDNTFNPEDTKLRHQYDFELIIETLQAFHLEKDEENIIECLVFDALIGNSDRHQENWAFITEHSSLSKSLSIMEYDLEHTNLNKAPKWLQKVIKKVYMANDSRKVKPEFKKVKLLMAKSTRFSPIYDSGCSFGRELTDERVDQLLKNEDQFEAYIMRGVSEIHWENKKISHFDLLKNLLADEHFSTITKKIINRVLEKFNPEVVAELINKIDVQLPEDCVSVKIPTDRKKLICKLVISRFDQIRRLV